MSSCLDFFRFIVSDLDETVDRQMPAVGHELDTARELLEVLLFRAPHRVLSEERDDRLQQIGSLADDVAIQMLAVVVVPRVNEYLSYVEELTKIAKALDA